MVVSAILASSDLIAMLPAVPVFVGAISLAPAIQDTIIVKSGIAQRCVKFKELHREYNNLIKLTRLEAVRKMTDDELVTLITKLNKKYC